jgi:hypothetical protein
MFPKDKFKNHVFKKGNQTDFVKKKVDRYKLGLPIECKKHGLHLKWRLHTDNNVQCLHCCAEWQMNQRRKNPLRFLLRDAKAHAKHKNREFNLTIDDMNEVLESQNNKCIFTGLEFNDDNVLSLDRIDSKMGYTRENIQFITIRANKMKSDMSDNEFLNYCSIIVRHSAADRGMKPKNKKD